MVMSISFTQSQNYRRQAPGEKIRAGKHPEEIPVKAVSAAGSRVQENPIRWALPGGIQILRAMDTESLKNRTVRQGTQTRQIEGVLPSMELSGIQNTAIQKLGYGFCLFTDKDADRRNLRGEKFFQRCRLRVCDIAVADRGQNKSDIVRHQKIGGLDIFRTGHSA